MEKNEEQVTVVELLLREPEIVAWLEELLPAEAPADDDEPLQAA